jgi:hypothetical protein
MSEPTEQQPDTDAHEYPKTMTKDGHPDRLAENAGQEMNLRHRGWRAEAEPPVTRGGFLPPVRQPAPTSEPAAEPAGEATDEPAGAAGPPPSPTPDTAASRRRRRTTEAAPATATEPAPDATPADKTAGAPAGGMPTE